MRRRLTQSRRISIKDYWHSHSEQITLGWIAIKGAVDVHSCAASGLWSVKDPDGVRATVPGAAQVPDQVRSYWQSLYNPCDVDLSWFAEQVRKHIPNVIPPQDWESLYSYTMDDLNASIEASIGKSPGPNGITGELLNSLPSTAWWLMVHANKAILRGVPPPKDWKDALFHILPMRDLEGYLDSYGPLALGQTDMKVLLRPVLQRFLQLLTKNGIFSEAQHGSLQGASVDAAIFVAQRKLASAGPSHVISFDASKAFDSAPHGAISLVLTHLGMPQNLRSLFLFAHVGARVRLIAAHGLTEVVILHRGVRQGAVESPILYNLLLEPLLRALPSSVQINPDSLLSGYCDDLVLIVHSWEDLHSAVEYMSKYLAALGMSFNPKKGKFMTTEQAAGVLVFLSGKMGIPGSGYAGVVSGRPPRPLWLCFHTPQALQSHRSFGCVSMWDSFPPGGRGGGSTGHHWGDSQVLCCLH